tara:strand:- start:691 stop:1170 length:480 start_codon:yes stop_codon:yes gene_type:complete
LIIIFCFIIYIQSINSQRKFGKVNLDLLVKEHPLNFYYDSIYSSEEKKLYKSISLKDSLINVNYKKSIGYDYTEKGLNESLKKMNELISKRNIYANSIVLKLNQLKLKHQSLIKNQILSEIKNYARVNKFEFIVDYKLILFEGDKSIKDLTDKIRVKIK